MAQGSEQGDVTEMTVVASNQTYVVQRNGNDLRVGRQADGVLLWQDETIPIDSLPADARTALDEGRSDEQALVIALESAVQAFIQRGG